VIVRIGMAPRADGLDHEGFAEHWSGEHGGLAAEIPGLRSYVQNHAILFDGLPLLPDPGFDACSEIEFDSIEAMDSGFASEHYRSTVVADEHSLIDKSRFTLLLAAREVAVDGAPPEDAVKLLTFLPPGTPPPGTAGAVRHERLVELPGAHDERPRAPFAVVDARWFATVDDALSVARGEQPAPGTVRRIARPVWIVRR
jgi:uncharacterized protein (TIGR02118 family)